MQPTEFRDAANVNARPAQKAIARAKNVIDLNSRKTSQTWRRPARVLPTTEVLLTGGYAA